MEKFAVGAGDNALQAQLGQCRHVLSLERTTGTVIAWQLASKTEGDIALTDANNVFVTKLRQAARGARFHMVELDATFTPASQEGHLIHDLDVASVAAAMKVYIASATVYLDKVQQKWRNTMMKFTNDIKSWLPEWTDATLFNEDVVKVLLGNANFSASGISCTRTSRRTRS